MDPRYMDNYILIPKHSLLKIQVVVPRKWVQPQQQCKNLIDVHTAHTSGAHFMLHSETESSMSTAVTPDVQGRRGIKKF